MQERKEVIENGMDGDLSADVVKAWKKTGRANLVFVKCNENV